MKNIKVLITVGIVILIYALVMFFAFGKSKTPKVDDGQEQVQDVTSSSYMIIEDKSYKYVDEKLIKTGISAIEHAGKFSAYSKSKYLGDFTLKYGNTWNLFNDKNEFISNSGNLIAATLNMNLTVKDITIRELNDSDKYDLINKFNVESFAYLTTNQVVDIDLDNNGTQDKIICLSSKEENPSRKYYDLVVIKFNDDYITLIDSKEDNPNIYDIFGVINVFNKKSDSVVIRKSMGIYSDDIRQDYLLINYVNNNYSID